MGKGVWLLLALLLVFTPVFAQETLGELIGENFNYIVSFALFAILFSIIYSSMTALDETKTQRNTMVALAGSVTPALLNLAETAYTDFVYWAMFTVPFGLPVFIGVLIIVNLLLIKETWIKITASVILAILLAVVLMSTNIISTSVTQNEATSGGSIINYVAIIAVLVIGVIIYLRIRKKKSGSPTTSSSSPSSTTPSGQKKKGKKKDDSATPAQSSAQLSNYYKNFALLMDKLKISGGSRKTFLQKLEIILSEPNREQMLTSDNVMKRFEKFYYDAGNVFRRRSLVKYFWEVYFGIKKELGVENFGDRIRSYKDFIMASKRINDDVDVLEDVTHKEVGV